jgi:chaperonin GroEL (HSP60 family)
MYDSLRDILIPKIVVNRNNLPDNDKEVEMEKHNIERDSQMISFCKQVRNMIETWLKKKADPNANQAL